MPPLFESMFIETVKTKFRSFDIKLPTLVSYPAAASGTDVPVVGHRHPLIVLSHGLTTTTHEFSFVPNLLTVYRLTEGPSAGEAAESAPGRPHGAK